MLSFKNKDVYDTTADYIFGLTTSKVLDLKKLTVLFQKNKFPEPNPEIVDSLQVYYNNKNLTQSVVKPVDLNAKYAENLLENNLKDMYKDDKNNLNIEALQADLNDLDPSVDFSLFKEFLVEEVKLDESGENNIDVFYDYVKNNFFNF